MEHVGSAKLSHMVVNIVAYAEFEFASLLYVHAFLKWEFNISALYLLANVLEREMILLQSVFMLWVVSLL